MADDITDLPNESAQSEPMTDAQKVVLDRLFGQTGEPTPNEHLTEMEADEKIKELLKEADDKDVLDQDEP